MAVFQPPARTSRRRWPLLLSLALLAGCAAGPGSTPPSGRASSAELAYQDGRYVEAMAAFAARAGGGAEGQHWHLRAADAAWQAGLIDQAQIHLQSLDRRMLDDGDRALAGLLAVLLEDQPPPHRVLALLDGPPERIPVGYRAAFHEARARALLEAGQPYPSALERLAADPWLLVQDARDRNRDAILPTLQRLTGQQAAEYRTRHQPGDEMFGWLTLVEMLKSGVFSGQSAASVVALWRGRFPDHPASRSSIEDLLISQDLDFQRPLRIALLLPLGDERLRRAAEAVRDGFLAAYYADGQPGAVIRIYDTLGTPERALASYRLAMAEGATQIVGPLDRAAVTAVLLEADGSVPLLALNYQESQAPTASGVYQFGLQPEEEARAAAVRMLENGHWRAVALTPGTGWGLRLENAFVEHFERLGGTVIGRYRYVESETDQGAVVQQAVGTTDARLRERQLQRVLGVPLSFDPQPRHDVDALFLAARSAQARQIKPQLAFYNAGDLPTYATSHAYAGIDDPDADRDLNGLRFCDAPWLLGAQSYQPSLKSIRDTFPEAQTGNVRLIAVGIDAYRVLPYLGWLTRYRNDSFPGVTGQLSVDSRDRIRRRLDCAIFRNGLAVHEPPPMRFEDPAP